MTDFEAANIRTPAPPPPPRPIEYADVDTSGWWISMLLGLVLLVLGVWLLTNLFASVVVLALLVGASLIVGGVAEIVAVGRDGGAGWPAWLGGAVVVALGIAVLVWPDITLLALALLAGAALVVAGALRIAAALYRRDRSEMPAALALGGLGIVLGVVIMAWPDATIVVLAIVLGLRAVASGLVGLALGWRMWRVSRLPA